MGALVSQKSHSSQANSAFPAFNETFSFVGEANNRRSVFGGIHVHL